MLILEAKVREGVKPVVTIDSRATVGKVAEAVLSMLEVVYDQLEKRHYCDAVKFHDLITSAFRQA